MKRWHALLGGASAVAAFVAARRAYKEKAPIAGVMDHAQTEVYSPEYGTVDDAKVEAPLIAAGPTTLDAQVAKP